MQKTLLLSVSLFLFVFSNAQVKQVIKADGKKMETKSIDQLVSTLMEEGEVTGLAISIINDNKPVFEKTYGYKNKATKELNDTSTCFYAASLAKPLFAVLVMQLVEAGKLNLDKPIYTYLPKPIPEYDEYKDLASDNRWKLITARHCLAHTTGFPNWREFNPNENNKLEFFFTPGERYAYSGEGIYLLQLVVETITGKKLEALAQEKYSNPLEWFVLVFFGCPISKIILRWVIIPMKTHSRKISAFAPVLLGRWKLPWPTIQNFWQPF